MRVVRAWIFGIVVVGVVGVVGALIARELLEGEAGGRGGGAGGERAPAPVEVGEVEVGSIEDRRVFSGTLQATARLTIAPKIAGRIERLAVDLADTVRRGQVVAELDSDEYEQAVTQAEAELAVARASLVEAESAAEIATRELERVRTLHDRGVASDSQLDTVTAEQYSKSAGVEVAKAQVTRAEAALRAARIRLGYTTIHADWEGGDDERVVAERRAEEGDTVAANTALMSIIELDPIEAVIYATEREYALLSAGQGVSLSTDAYPGRRWEGRVVRVSPVFREGSRQARVEVRVPNEGDELKPGMFARVEATLRRAEGATIVAREALAQRGERTVVFIVEPGRDVVRMVPVRVGIREGDRVQVFGEGVEGRVVTLGQQLLEDGSAVTFGTLGGGGEGGRGTE